jgi:hypothetical protein
MVQGTMAYASGYGIVWQELENFGFPDERIDHLEQELSERFSSLRPDTAVIPAAAIRELRLTYAGGRPISPDLLRFRNIHRQASLADMLSGRNSIGSYPVVAGRQPSSSCRT